MTTLVSRQIYVLGSYGVEFLVLFSKESTFDLLGNIDGTAKLNVDIGRMKYSHKL